MPKALITWALSELCQTKKMHAPLVRLSLALLLSCLVIVFEAAHTLGDQAKEGPGHTSSWTHRSQEAWPREFPLCASESMRPSPIDIHTCATTYKPKLKIRLKNYNHEIPVNLMTSHHSVSIKPKVNPTPSVRLNWLPKGEREFDLQEIHFHWDTDGDHKGSEHAINGNQAAAEMHLVHFKRGIDKDDIGRIENSIVVLGVMIEPNDSAHMKIDKLVRDLAKVNGTDQEFDGAEPELLHDLLPDDYSNFYTYNGSLTTPPCFEVVTWVVMNSPIFMSREQLAQMANLEFKEADGIFKKIGPNHRNIQPLHERPVFASFNVSDAVIPKPASQPTNSLVFNDKWRKIIISFTVNGNKNKPPGVTVTRSR